MRPRVTAASASILRTAAIAARATAIRDAGSAADAVRLCPCAHPEPDTRQTQDQRGGQRIPEPFVNWSQPFGLRRYRFEGLDLAVHALQRGGVGGTEILASRRLRN